eukprot:7460474-Alexandrium_andersonii.AAC.1
MSARTPGPYVPVQPDALTPRTLRRLPVPAGACRPALAHSPRTRRLLTGTAPGPVDAPGFRAASRRPARARREGLAAPGTRARP